MLQRWFGGSQGSWGHEKTQKAFLAGVISRGAPQWTLKGYFLYYYIIARDISSAERAIILPRSERVSQGFSCQYPERPCTTQGSQRRMLHRKIPESMGTAWTVRPFGSYKFCGVGCHFFLQGIFLTQGSNLCLLYWKAGALPLSHQCVVAPSM